MLTRLRVEASHATRGFSLIETLVATTLLTIAVGGLAHLATAATSTNQRARSSTLATLLASSKVEELLAVPWNDQVAQASNADTSLERNVRGLLRSSGRLWSALCQWQRRRGLQTALVGAEVRRRPGQRPGDSVSWSRAWPRPVARVSLREWSPSGRAETGGSLRRDGEKCPRVLARRVAARDVAARDHCRGRRSPCWRRPKIGWRSSPKRPTCSSGCGSRSRCFTTIWCRPERERPPASGPVR